MQAEPDEYTYNADTYCPRCICRVIGKRQMPGKTAEESLAVYAKQAGIDYSGPVTWDTGVFPVAQWDSDHGVCGDTGTSGDGMPHCNRRCGRCHAVLGADECPALTHAMYQVIADGIPWQDPDGVTEWSGFEVGALAESVERRGYAVEIVPA